MGMAPDGRGNQYFFLGTNQGGFDVAGPHAIGGYWICRTDGPGPDAAGPPDNVTFARPSTARVGPPLPGMPGPHDGGNVFYLSREKEPEMFKLAKADMDLEFQTRQVAIEYRGASSDERPKIKAQLQGTGRKALQGPPGTPHLGVEAARDRDSAAQDGPGAPAEGPRQIGRAKDVRPVGPRGRRVVLAAWPSRGRARLLPSQCAWPSRVSHDIPRYEAYPGTSRRGFQPRQGSGRMPLLPVWPKDSG